MLDHVARDADELIGDTTNAALIIDESGITKQDEMYVGASSQYLGRLGKVDNGQVAIFEELAKGRFPQRLILGSTCRKNGPMIRSDATGLHIPESDGSSSAKPTGSGNRRAGPSQRSGLGWVGADAGYGSGPDFLFALEDGDHNFLVDVHKSRHCLRD